MRGPIHHQCSCLPLHSLGAFIVTSSGLRKTHLPRAWISGYLVGRAYLDFCAWSRGACPNSFEFTLTPILPRGQKKKVFVSYKTLISSYINFTAITNISVRVKILKLNQNLNRRIGGIPVPRGAATLRSFCLRRIFIYLRARGGKAKLLSLPGKK